MFNTISITNDELRNVWKKFENIVLIGVVENPNESEWGDPYFAQLKPRTNQAHILL